MKGGKGGERGGKGKRVKVRIHKYTEVKKQLAK